MAALLSSRTNVRDLLRWVIPLIFICSNRRERGIARAIPALALRVPFSHEKLLPANLYSGRPALHPSGRTSCVQIRSGRICRTMGVVKYLAFQNLLKKMAESEGFEPSIRFPVYTLSRGAPSATRPALRYSNCLLALG